MCVYKVGCGFVFYCVKNRNPSPTLHDWFFKIEVVADTDLDGDGKRDWLLWLIDEAKSGNYRGYSVLTVNTVSEAGFLAAEVFR